MLRAVGLLFQRGWAWLTLAGRLRLVQPLALLPGPVALALALVLSARWLFFVAYVYLLLVVAAYTWVRLLGPRVVLRRNLNHDWAQVGDMLEETWEVSNHSALPLLWLELDDHSTVPGYSARRIAAASPGQQERWRTAARCERRGVYQLGPLDARLADPLGIFQYTWREPHTRPLVVYPPLARLPALALPRGQRGGLARADMLQLQATPSVGGLRSYAPGDPPSRIHWPTVARTGQLMIKEFDQEQAGALWIVLDLAHGGYPSETAANPAQHSETSYTQRSSIDIRSTNIGFERGIDLAVVLASSLAAAALAEGRMVGLLADDGRRRLVPPGNGPRQLWQIMRELVDVEATGNIALGDLIGQSSMRQHALAGGMAVITPALDGAWLPALHSLRGQVGALALLIASNRAQAATSMARLASAGVAAHAFDPTTPLALLNPPPAETTARVSPLGRVIGAA